MKGILVQRNLISLFKVLISKGDLIKFLLKKLIKNPKKAFISLLIGVLAFVGVVCFNFSREVVVDVLNTTGNRSVAEGVIVATEFFNSENSEVENQKQDDATLREHNLNEEKEINNLDYPDQDSNHPGNHSHSSFQHVKRVLLSQIYKGYEETLYCGYTFDSKTKKINLPASFSAEVHQERSPFVELEHVVPADHFGSSFREWSHGAGRCINKNGTHYKGRRCADEVSVEYRFMQADMYNLFPAVGSVNALRSNFPYAMLEGVQNSFGSCEMKVADGKAEPPERARGRIARAMLYMAATYPTRYKMDEQTKKMVEDWNQSYPATETECIIASRIEEFQKNPNPFVIEACRRAGLPYREQ